MALIGITLAGAISCDLEPVTPSPSELQTWLGRPAADVLPGDSPDNVSAATESFFGDGSGPSTFLGYYPSRTVVVATGKGLITWVADWGASGSYGPAGHYSNGVKAEAYLTWREGTLNRRFGFGKDVSPFPGQWIDSVTVILSVRDSVSVARATNGNTNNYVAYCGPYNPSNPWTKLYCGTSGRRTRWRKGAIHWKVSMPLRQHVRL